MIAREMPNNHEISEFKTALATNAERIEQHLDALLTQDRLGRKTPDRILGAMRYGTLDGGKRLRPFLVIETARLFDEERQAVLDVACACELLHCYSLIHDDLPAMDDDDLRRGRPTVHRAFDEATAILAGDALLTHSFGVISEADLEADRKIQLIAAFSKATGAAGMVGGQDLDLAAESKEIGPEDIYQLQAMKTGALLRFSCEAGAIIAGEQEKKLSALTQYGEKIGAAFQLADDILDVTSTAEEMGKATGKDEAAGKGTLVAHYGLEWAIKERDRLVGEAKSALDPFGSKAQVLLSAADFIAQRTS